MKNEFFVYGQKGKDLVEHYKYMESLPELKGTFELFEKAGIKLPTRQFNHLVRFNEGFLLFITYEEVPEAHDIFKRFGKVFEQTYTRFLDLKKAEAQARESEIELALERVRARTMAMQKSEEIGDVAFILFQQLKSLGGNLWGTGFGFCKADSDIDEYWLANEKGVMPHLKVPNKIDPTHKQMYQGWKKNLEILSIEKGGKELKAHYKYMLSVPDLQPIFQSILDDGIAFPKWQKWHAAYFKYGYLLVITTETYENEDIFKRFAKVFEQTYTRFLDLQKAEEQAREAEIELALERVRAKTMAMHKSEELKDVIQVVYNQFIQLNINIEHTGFIIDYKQNEDMHIWLADKNAVFPKVILPYFDCAHWNSFKDTKKNGKDFFVNHLSFKEKNKFYKDLFRFIPDVPKEAKDHYFSCPGLAISTVLIDNVGLYIENFKGIPYSEEENSILMRFGKVFQQTYTRFLDLQKAEAQAREAQIETALERVRSRSMAMQKSNELLEAGELLWNEITKLGIDCFTSGYVLMDDKEDIGWNYTPNPSTGKILEQAIGIPHKQTPPMRKIVAEWKKQEPLCVIELTRKQTIAHQTFVAEKGINFPFSAKQLVEISPKEIVLHTFNFKQGYLLIVGGEKISKDQIDLMLRFTKVFQQTYTRFLDLKKAEAQTREGQIEVAVERIRAQSMAMHHPDDLENVNSEIYKQLQLLNINGLTGVSIWLIAENNFVKIWDLSSPGHMGNPNSYSVAFDAKKYDILGEPIRFLKKSKENYFVFHYPLKKLQKAIKEWALVDSNVANTFKNAVKTGKLTQQWNPLARHSNGLLSIDLVEPPNEDTKTIVTKITAAFNQAYIRFLDLQKAEAQAREAQIEAALERTRTQSMLMQHSDELNVTAQVFHQQLQLLGIDSEFSYLWLPDDGEKTHKFWATWSDTKKGKTIYNNKTVSYPLDKNEPSIAACYVAWESEQTVHVNTVQPNKVEDYFNTWSELLDGVDKFKPELFPNGLYYVDAYMKYGCFGIMIKRLLTTDEENILSRFSKEFQRTYTRFLDLQKAEAQAREAQIEAALERIRSKSMGMQSSGDLSNVTNEMFTQLRQFGGDLYATGIVFCDKHEGLVEQWHSIPKAGMTSPFLVPFDLDYIHQYRYDEWKKGTKLFSVEIPSDFIKQHFEAIFNLPSTQKILKEFEDQNTPMPAAPEWEIDYGASFKYGYILVSSLQPFKEADILPRFAKVFEQTYTRFLDLQKAEAQAREAKIEAALEKVRSRTMAMQKGEEVKDVVVLLYKELIALGVTNFATCGYVEINEETNRQATWVTNPGGDSLGLFYLAFKRRCPF